MLLTKRVAIAAHSCEATVNILISLRNSGTIHFKRLKLEGGEK